MKTNLLLLLNLFLAVQISLAQGYIDIDTNIQMGMVNSEHVKITSSGFNIHNNNANQPLIYGDFATGNVGIGTDDPTKKLDVSGSVGVSNNLIVEGKVTGDKIHTFSGEKWFYGWNYTRTIHTLEAGEVGLLTVGQSPNNWSSYYKSAIVYKTHYGVLVSYLGTGTGESVHIQANGDNVEVRLATGQNTKLFWTYLRLR